MIVKKWAAGFGMDDQVVLARYPFRVTPKKFIMEFMKDAEGRQMQTALKYQSHFNQQEAKELLHDTPLLALKALDKRQQRLILNAKGKIEHAEERRAKITVACGEIE